VTIVKGDVVFARGGEPVIIASKNPRSGQVTTDRNFSRVQDATETGVKNGLAEAQKEAFNTVLSEVRDDDARQEIDKLSAKVAEMRKDGTDPRLLRYLRGELQFRMTKERYEPVGYQVDELTLLSS